MSSFRIGTLLLVIVFTTVRFDHVTPQTTVSSFYDVACWSGQPNQTLNVSAHVPGTCANQYSFQCTNGTCIDISYWNDCVVDCSDGSDELCSPG
uniref:Uncharacterized protein n=1 Tax=Romanomermis culicivorax TaxID=13658 RepID=A0A915K246_ROMCU